MATIDDPKYDIFYNEMADKVWGHIWGGRSHLYGCGWGRSMATPVPLKGRICPARTNKPTTHLLVVPPGFQLSVVAFWRAGVRQNN